MFNNNIIDVINGKFQLFLNYESVNHHKSESDGRTYCSDFGRPNPVKTPLLGAQSLQLNERHTISLNFLTRANKFSFGECSTLSGKIIWHIVFDKYNMQSQGSDSHDSSDLSHVIPSWRAGALVQWLKVPD